jgi:hypothetical protein
VFKAAKSASQTGWAVARATTLAMTPSLFNEWPHGIIEWPCQGHIVSLAVEKAGYLLRGCFSQDELAGAGVCDFVNALDHPRFAPLKLGYERRRPRLQSPVQLLARESAQSADQRDAPTDFLPIKGPQLAAHECIP